MLYNNIFVLQRYTKECGVHECLSVGVRVSEKAKITAQDSITYIFMILEDSFELGFTSVVLSIRRLCYVIKT